jgi:hypothetical protein
VKFEVFYQLKLLCCNSNHGAKTLEVLQIILPAAVSNEASLCKTQVTRKLSIQSSDINQFSVSLAKAILIDCIINLIHDDQVIDKSSSCLTPIINPIIVSRIPFLWNANRKLLNLSKTHRK